MHDFELSSATRLLLSTPQGTPGVRDRATYAITAVFRVVRVMLLWIALYFVDRAYQSAYVQRVLVDGKEPSCNLWTLVLAALAIEASVLLLLLGLAFLLKVRFKSADNTFVVDGALLGSLAADYALSTSIVAAVGAGLGVAVQDVRNFRFRDDGLRGIRALSSMLLLVAAVTIGALPSVL